MFDITSAEDEELLDNGSILQVSGSYVFPNGNSEIGLSLFKGDGIQDINDAPDDNPTDVSGGGIYYAYHQQNAGAFAGLTYKIGYDKLKIEEESTSGDIDEINHDRVYISLTAHFGAQKKSREMAVAALPNIMWINSSVGLVD